MASVGGSDKGPATPGHASIMSGYGHSSYGGSNRSSSNSHAPSHASGNKGPNQSATSHARTYIDAGTQTSPARGTPPSQPTSRPPPSFEQYSNTLTKDEKDLVSKSAIRSQERRRGR